MKTLMDKITHFETRTNCTVREFNEVFDMKLEGLDPDLEVEIGELADTDTTRFLTVGTLVIKHNFAKTPKFIAEAEEGGGKLTDGHVKSVREARPGKRSAYAF